MKNYLIASVLIFLLNSCSDQLVERWVCTCRQQDSVRAFMKSSIKSANNMSDEEMEDVIHQLYKDGVRVNCTTKPVYIYSGRGDINFLKTKLDSCETVMEMY